MKSSLEIAQEAELVPIEKIAEACGLEPDEIEPYGRYKAKIDLGVIDRLADRPDGKLDLRHRHDADEGGRGQDDDARRPHPGPRRTSASGRSPACASRRSARCSASRAAPPAAA